MDFDEVAQLPCRKQGTEAELDRELELNRKPFSVALLVYSPSSSRPTVRSYLHTPRALTLTPRKNQITPRVRLPWHMSDR